MHKPISGKLENANAASHPTNCIYLDYNASTPIDPRVYEVLATTLSSEYGNPHSMQHKIGRAAAKIINSSLATLADFFNAFPEDIIFTSGATEANNLALFGIFRGIKHTNPQLITLETEHKSVLEPVYALRAKGVKTKLLPVENCGRVNLNVLEAELKNHPKSIVSIGAANSEIGVIQPLEEIGLICSHYDCFWHCDATQAVGKIDLRFKKYSFDMITFSGHKIYGPKGIGALIINPKTKDFLQPIIKGGGQQYGYRSGTLPTFLCAALSEACRISHLEMHEENKRVAELRNSLLGYLTENLGGVLNGSLDYRLSNNINISFPGIRAIDIIALTPQIAISTGSACSSAGGVVAPSYVLHALGLAPDRLHGALRISIGRFTTEKDINSAKEALSQSILQLKLQS